MSILNTTYENYDISIGSLYIIRVEHSIIPNELWKTSILSLWFSSPEVLSNQIKDVWENLYPLISNPEVEVKDKKDINGYYITIHAGDLDHLSFYLVRVSRECAEMSELITEYESQTT